MTKTKNTLRKVSLGVAISTVVATVLYADLKQGSYAPSQLGSLEQAAPVQLVPDSNYEVSAYPAPALELAPGEGLQEVRIYCNTCHSPRYITMQPPLPPAPWEAEVNKMNKAFGSNIPDETSREIIAYLQAHYSTGNRR
jgi:mono/diheme cytochrome c family protein